MAAKFTWYGKAFEEDVKRALKDAMDESAQVINDHIKQKLSGGRRGDIGTGAQGPGMPPAVDMGRLRNMVFWDAPDRFSRRIGVMRDEKAPGKAIALEIGAHIKAKKGSYLAIPWSAAAKNHSRSGGSAKTFDAGGKRLFRVGRNKNATTIFLVERVRGKNARHIIHYILTQHVDIPPHPYLRPSLDECRAKVQKIFDRPMINHATPSFSVSTDKK